MIDLHLHTTMSDGQLSPAQVVDAAAQNGLAAISITDHDTVSGLHEGMGLRPHAARTYTAIKTLQAFLSARGWAICVFKT